MTFLRHTATSAGTACVCGLIIALAAIGAKPISPCTPIHTDVASWPAATFDEWRYFQLPRTFVPDTAAKCGGGCKRWKDGSREIEVVAGHWDNSSFRSGEPSYSECVDSLAGLRFRLITVFSRKDRTYCAFAVSFPRHTGELSSVLLGRSPVKADLDLFLAVFRTVRVEPSRFIGGSTEHYSYYDQEPVPITKVEPFVPDLLGTPDTTVTFIMHVFVGTDGLVKDVKTIKPVRGFNEAAVEAVKKWVFKPATYRGKPVAVWTEVPINFRLH